MYCDYGNQFQEILRDRLVCGVNHRGNQRKLLSEADLTFDRTYALAQMIEASEWDSKKLSDKPPGQDSAAREYELHFSHTFHRRNGKSGRVTEPARSPSVTYYCCCGPHLATQCRHKNAVCHYCKKRGYLVRACKKKPRREQRAANGQSAHYLEREPTAAEEVGNMFLLSDKTSAPYLLQLQLNGVPVKMELDTGASVSVSE